MKKIGILIIGVLLSSCTTNESVTIYLDNTSSITRLDAAITLSREEIASLAEVSDTLFPALVNSNGKPLPGQVDDMDGDGSWDELFVITDFAGNEVKEVTVSFYSKENYPNPGIRTNIRLADKKNGYAEVSEATREIHATNTITAEKWQMEGVAWENDYIGFRNYFDRRNGMDIFGKVVNAMVLDDVGNKKFPYYHVYDPAWGCDVLKVGESLGAGSIAYNFRDSLYRVGDNGLGTYQVLTEGPLRSVFRFQFNNWDMSGTFINVLQDVSIQAGTFYYESEVTYSGIEDNLELVTGIVNKKSIELFEVTEIDGHKAFYTHDLQSEDTTLLGMGILIPADDFVGTSTTPDNGKGIIETYCIHLTAEPNQPIVFRFYSVWERQDEKWTNREAFEELLRREAEFETNPVLVRYKQ